jgi:hypothetical protein
VARGVEARIGWVRELARRLPAEELASIVEMLGRLTEAADELETDRKSEPAMVRSNA